MRSGKREVDVSMMRGRGNKKEEGPQGWLMGFLTLLTSAPGSTGKGSSSDPWYTDYLLTELPAPPVPVDVMGAGSEGYRREGVEGSLEHLEDFQSQSEGKIRLQTCPAHRLYLLPRMTPSSSHTPETGVQSGPGASTSLFSLPGEGG